MFMQTGKGGSLMNRLNSPTAGLAKKSPGQT